MGFNYLFFLPVILPSEIPRLATDLVQRVFPGIWKLLCFLRLPSQDRSPSLSFASLFICYILSYLLSKTMGCFSGYLMSSASIQKLFCGICSVHNCSFDEFVGEKFVSPSYSSAILGPPLVLSLLYGPHLTSIHDYWRNHSFDYTDICQQSDVSAF